MVHLFCGLFSECGPGNPTVRKCPSLSVFWEVTELLHKRYCKRVWVGGFRCSLIIHQALHLKYTQPLSLSFACWEICSLQPTSGETECQLVKSLSCTSCCVFRSQTRAVDIFFFPNSVVRQLNYGQSNLYADDDANQITTFTLQSWRNECKG